MVRLQFNGKLKCRLFRVHSKLLTKLQARMAVCWVFCNKQSHTHAPSADVRRVYGVGRLAYTEHHTQSDNLNDMTIWIAVFRAKMEIRLDPNAISKYVKQKHWKKKWQKYTKRQRHRWPATSANNFWRHSSSDDQFRVLCSVCAVCFSFCTFRFRERKKLGQAL